MLRFTQDEIPQIKFLSAKKKPIAILCAQIHEPFEVESMEGVMSGKAGDWLMVGINGEKYVCDDAIFKQSYDLCIPDEGTDCG
ncbi:hypothetical protein EI546_01965 [Aequorivita sp. H23M31]|uniref:Uncharacterized protein n=1 Tax=Aequorivita ciconiae TaxID=2494375 RepID=A0A410FZZ6_9FLAO|nr:PGDYG domain-containing protein [Aequorivita sp. H23M31]QAA80570.1 hypothetical protein EI546_01965 [Aequorivita sp. H23M31]